MNFMNNLLKVGCSEVKVQVDMFITNHVHFHRRLSEPQHSKLSSTDVTMDAINQQQQQQQQQYGAHDLRQFHVVQHHHQQVPNQDDESAQTMNEIAEILRDIGDQVWREHSNTSPSKAQTFIDCIPSLMICGVTALTIYQCVRQQ